MNKSDQRPHNAVGRREFLATGASAFGAAALSGVLPTQALAQEASVSTLIQAAVVADPLRGVIEKNGAVKFSNGAFAGSTDTVAKLMAPTSDGRYDVMMTLSEIGRAPVLGARAGQERAIPLDPKLLPNMAQLSDSYKGAIVERDGKVYTVPVTAGFDSVIYNRDHVPDNDPLINSWGLIFSDKYAGRIAWMDEPYYTQMIAGLYLGHPAPQNADAKEVAEIANFLIKQKKNVRAMWTTAAQQISLMQSGEVVAMHGQIPARVTLKSRGLNVANNWPKEGLVVWTTSLFVPKSSRNPAGGQAFINAMLTGEYGAALTRETGYISPSKLAEGHLSAQERTQAGYDLDARGVKRFTYAAPKDYNIWIESWARVKSA